MIKNLFNLTDFKLLKSLPTLGFFLFITSGYLNAQSKIDPRFEDLIKKRKINSAQKKSNTLVSNEVLPIISIISPDGTIKEYYQTIIYTQNAEQLKKDGFIIQSESKDFVTALLSDHDIDRLRENSTISAVKLSEINYLQNQSNLVASGADLLQNGVLNNTNYTGKDILIGIIDSGIDFTHPDFIDPVTKQSRILSIWDQTITPNENENSPNLYENPQANFGVEYTQAHINNELSEAPVNYIRQADTTGHGTHVAGTAAGNGSALEGTPHKGMAPEATLAIVKGGDYGISSTNIMASLDYFKKIANEQGKPIVVNISADRQDTPHDGRDVEEIMINEFSNSAPGRVVVISAGNSGDSKIHQRINLAPNEKKSFKIDVGENNSNDHEQVFGFLAFNKGENNTSTFKAKLTTPTGEVFIQEADGQSTHVLQNQDNVDYLALAIYNYVSLDHGKRLVQLFAKRLTTQNTEGIYDLEIENTSNDNLTLDGWLALTNPLLANMSLSEGDNNYTVGAPGTADEAITVANYVSNTSFVNGENLYADQDLQKEALHPSSAKGPTTEEVRKPDITAGGTYVISAKTKDNTDPLSIDGKYYSQMTGTSMSSPTVAGGAALLLQANSQLTARNLKQRLIENVNHDNFTTNDYTNEFGYGKLNIYKAVSAEVNISNNNTACPSSFNYTLASDNLNYKLGEETSFMNYEAAHVAVKLTSQATGKLGNITYFLGNYNNNTATTIPLTVEIRKVNSEGTPGDLITTKVVDNIKTLEQAGWNNLSFADDDIDVVAGQEFFVILNTGSLYDLFLGTDFSNSTENTFISFYGGPYLSLNVYNAKIRATVYEDLPAVKQLATTSKSATQAVSLGYNHFVNGCELITRVEANGASPISGNTTAKVWINADSNEYVQRIIEVNNENNNSTSTGKVTLFYTQADFDAYNQNATIQFPTSPTDTENKANIYLHYFAGNSDDNTGTPASYNTSPVNTKLTADKVVWNDTYKYWEVTVDAVGFGGYLLSTNTTLSNLDNSLSQLAVYPNPVVNELSVNLPSNVKNAQINIFDVTGRAVIKTEVTKSSDKINVSNLSKGVYIIEIKTTNGTVTKKIIKN